MKPTLAMTVDFADGKAFAACCAVDARGAAVANAAPAPATLSAPMRAWSLASGLDVPADAVPVPKRARPIARAIEVMTRREGRAMVTTLPLLTGRTRECGAGHPVARGFYGRPTWL